MPAASESQWVIGITGASGCVYALALMDTLARLEIGMHVIISKAGYQVLRDEADIEASPQSVSAEAFLGRPVEQCSFYHYGDIGALPASGTARMSGMVIIPCSMATLGAIASGAGTNLIHRAADVTLKESRPLLCVPRETPLSAIHLENMLRLSRAGARIVPAMPAFYHRPAGVSEIVDMMTMKVLDQMGIDNGLVRRWKEPA